MFALRRLVPVPADEPAAIVPGVPEGMTMKTLDQAIAAMVASLAEKVSQLEQDRDRHIRLIYDLERRCAALEAHADARDDEPRGPC